MVICYGGQDTNTSSRHHRLPLWCSQERLYLAHVFSIVVGLDSKQPRCEASVGKT